MAVADAARSASEVEPAVGPGSTSAPSSKAWSLGARERSSDVVGRHLDRQGIGVRLKSGIASVFDLGARQSRRRSRRAGRRRRSP